MGYKTTSTIIEKIESMPTLPTVTFRVMEITGDSKSSASDLVKIISPDVSAKFLNLSTVYEVTNNPNRIFSGLNRLYSDSSDRFCIVGKPKSWFVGESKSIEVPFPINLVYLVFLSERYSIFEFGAEKADKEDSLSPEGWRNRYGELIWKKTS